MMQVVMSVDYVVTIIYRRNRDRDRSKALKVILEVRSKVIYLFSGQIYKLNCKLGAKDEILE